MANQTINKVQINGNPETYDVEDTQARQGILDLGKKTDKQIEQISNDLTQKTNQLNKDLVANEKEDAKTKRSLSALWDLNNGISYRFETDSEKTYQKKVLSGAKLASINKVGGQIIKQDDALIVSDRHPHNRLKKNAIEKRIGQLGEIAQIERKIFPHLIRHTTATNGLNRGMKVEEVQKMLGHENISTTMIYAKVAENTVKLNHTKCIV